MELKYYLDILRRWGWIMVLCTALAGIASYVYSARQPREYEGVSQYLVGPVLDNPFVRSGDLQAAGAVGQTYVALATSRPILQRVIDDLPLVKADGTPVDPRNLASKVTASWLDATQILTIRVRDGDPVRAAEISNLLGQILIERSPSGPTSIQEQRRQDAQIQIARLQERRRANEMQIEQLIAQLSQTLDQTSQRALTLQLDELRAQRDEIQKELNEQFTIIQSSSTNKIEVFQEAVPNYSPVAPEVVRNVLAALIAGLVLGLATMLMFEYFTDVIYTPEELRRLTGLTYLGGIAKHRRLPATAKSRLIVQERPETLSAESYRLLRTNLQLTGTDLHLPSLLITSPSRGDGKSEISANLAVSLARAGKQVILVDANLRRPRIASLFGLSDEQGLSNLFDTPHAQITPQPIASEPRLSVVPAGPISPNAPELLGSQRMFSLIQEFKSQADVVIFDSPPLLYSDALALAPQLDGVVLVVNSGTTGRENTVNAAEALKQVGATIVGTVLNRVKAGPAYSYYPTTQAQRKLALPAGTNNLVLEAAPNETLEPKQLIDEAEANIEDGDGEQVIELNGPTNPSTRKNRSRNG